MLKRLFKKLDILILQAFIGPFIATFFITLFVLVLQFFWLYIDDIVGKGVDMLTVARLIMYVGATLVPLALPLAVLLSSIMTFGNLGESFELIAIKSAGIPLLRFMRPLFIVSLIICYIAFLFNNNIIPVANLKMNTLKYDIIVSKPAFDIKEGVFYDKIEGYVIKIGKKEKDDSTIRNVVIYQQNNSGNQDDIIVSEKGKMVVTPDKKSLLFILQNGWIYQEGKGDRMSTNTEFVRIGFKDYKKVLDLTSFKLNKTDDSAFKNNYQMLTMRQLGKNIDSLEKAEEIFNKRTAANMSLGLRFMPYLDTTGWAETEKTSRTRSAYLLGDSAVKAEQILRAAAQARADSQALALKAQLKADSIARIARVEAAKKDSGKAAAAPPPNTTATAKPGTPDSGKATANIPAAVKPAASGSGSGSGKAAAIKPLPPTSFADLLPDSVRTQVLDRAISQANTVKIGLDQPSLLYDAQQNDLRRHRIAWHEKLTLSVACLVMFLIGAPLGSIIRKGGIGMPLIFAVIFFVVFFLLNNFGKKFANQDVLSPLTGMWLATFVLTPIGLFLVYKALHDSQLFNKEYYFRLIKNIRILLDKINRKRNRQGSPDLNA
ncbi:MAG TPA: LptF/LptG family permease [Puia sp.]|nr:LptF/LptG family permease [Puia sp.]